MHFKMIKKLLAVVFAASTIGSTVSSVGAFNEDDMKKVQNDINEYEKSIKQLENTVKMENISNPDILQQINHRIEANGKILEYIKNLINDKEDKNKAGEKLNAYILSAENSNKQLENKDENLNKSLEETKIKREALLKKLIKLFSEQSDNQQMNDNEKNNVNENDNKVIEDKHKIEEISDKLKKENAQFIKWRDDKKIKIEDDSTKSTRLKAVTLANSLRKNFNAKKSKEFIELADKAMKMMNQFKQNYESKIEKAKQEELRKSQKEYKKTFKNIYNDFL